MEARDDIREVRSYLLGFLAELGCPEPLDDAVLEYACGVLQSMAEDDSDEQADNLAHLDALLAGACGGRYEAAHEEGRQQQLAAVVHKARLATAIAPERVGPSASTSSTVLRPPHQAAKLTHKLRSLALSHSGGSGAGSDSGVGGFSQGVENVSPTGDRARSRNVPPVVQELVALCPGAVSEGFLHHALERRFQGSAEALATWLLDADRSELQDAEVEWEALRVRQAREEEQARLLKARSKQHILQKFDLQAVAQPKDPKKPGAKLELCNGKPGQQAQQPKVRYLDGRVVTTKGEKFIVEKMGEEWDGGSRGKVYTKGKRGKGFT